MSDIETESDNDSVATNVYWELIEDRNEPIPGPIQPNVVPMALDLCNEHRWMEVNCDEDAAAIWESFCNRMRQLQPNYRYLMVVERALDEHKQLVESPEDPVYVDEAICHVEENILDQARMDRNETTKFDQDMQWMRHWFWLERLHPDHMVWPSEEAKVIGLPMTDYHVSLEPEEAWSRQGSLSRCREQLVFAKKAQMAVQLVLQTYEYLYGPFGPGALSIASGPKKEVDSPYVTIMKMTGLFIDSGKLNVLPIPKFVDVLSRPYFQKYIAYTRATLNAQYGIKYGNEALDIRYKNERRREVVMSAASVLGKRKLVE
jgi:hypothetical protein